MINTNDYNNNQKSSATLYLDLFNAIELKRNHAANKRIDYFKISDEHQHLLEIFEMILRDPELVQEYMINQVIIYLTSKCWCFTKHYSKDN